MKRNLSFQEINEAFSKPRPHGPKRKLKRGEKLDRTAALDLLWEIRTALEIELTNLHPRSTAHDLCELQIADLQRVYDFFLSEK